MRALLLNLPFLLGSCETVIELDPPTHEPKLVVNAVINPDSLFTIDVSASRSSFSDGAYQQLSDATVQVYQAEQLLFGLHHVGNGLYKADTKPQALQHYELRVSAPGFLGASANSYVPAAPAISYVLASEAAPDSQNSYPTVDAAFTLEDDPAQEDFYYLQAYTNDTSYIYERRYNRYISLAITSPIEQEFIMEERYFFSDKLFNGKSLRLKLNLQNSPEEVTYVQVAHINKEYYEYARTLHRQAGGDDFGKVFPTQVANNIQNGFGIFAGYNAITLALKP